MAKLKRNYIQLIKGENDKGELIFETYLTTPNQISVDLWDEAIDVMAEVEEMEVKYNQAIEKGKGSSVGKMMRNQRDMLMDLVVKIYDGQFNKEQLKNGLHAPEMLETLQSQVQFIAMGQQDEATKKFVESKS